MDITNFIWKAFFIIILVIIILYCSLSAAEFGQIYNTDEDVGTLSKDTMHVLMGINIAAAVLVFIYLVIYVISISSKWYQGNYLPKVQNFVYDQ
jgi:hypothetical protein